VPKSGVEEDELATPCLAMPCRAEVWHRGGRTGHTLPCRA
jgi:hypothetical protein